MKRGTNLKKTIALILALCLITATATGCAVSIPDATGGTEASKPQETVDGSNTQPPATQPPEVDSITVSQKNALRSAKNYLDFTPFSYSGLIKQLEFEEYSTEDATYAADNCGADWTEQADKAAKRYLESMAFSYTGLIKQLEFEGYTTEQATHGADVCGADWNEQAAIKAKNYLELMPFSRDSLITQLEYEGFTHEQAVYGADASGL